MHLDTLSSEQLAVFHVLVIKQGFSAPVFHGHTKARRAENAADAWQTDRDTRLQWLGVIAWEVEWEDTASLTFQQVV